MRSLSSEAEGREGLCIPIMWACVPHSSARKSKPGVGAGSDVRLLCFLERRLCPQLD